MINKQSTSHEAKLLKLIVNGDEAAFKELYELTSKRIYFYLFRLLKDKQAAEDVQIEVYTQVWVGAKKFKGKSKATTWIFGIARNLAMNELRKRKYNANIDDFPDIPDEKAPDFGNIDRKQIINLTMGKISSKHREILDLVFFHEMNYQEISTLLSISVNTVKTRVFYAKSALKKKMKQLKVNKNEL